MKKYVAVDDIFDALYPVDPECDGSDGCTVVLQNLTYSSADIEGLIDQIPAADVVPVLHGKWVTEPDEYGWSKHICSICKRVGRTDIYEHLKFKFCPYCGARMGGE